MILAAIAQVEAIEIRSSDPAFPGATRFEVGKSREWTYNAELGLDLSTLSVVIVPKKGASPKVEVAQDLITSLAVSEEGPHIDLLDWKHHVSERWILSSSAAWTYPIDDLSKRDQKAFPQYSEEELHRAIEKAGHPDWVKRMKDPSVESKPTPYVGASETRVHVRIFENGAWRALGTIRIMIPMGC